MNEKDKYDLENFGGIEIKEYKEEKDKEEDIIKKLQIIIIKIQINENYNKEMEL